MRSAINEANGDFFGVFDTISKGVADITQKDRDRRKSTSYIGGSISNYARKLTMSFPVLCDDSCDLHSAGIISRANEKNVATMLEMLFSSMAMSSKDVKSGAEMIAKFHKNIDAMTIDDYIDYANDLATRSECAGVSDTQVRDCLREMCSWLRNPDSKKGFPVNSFNEKTLEDYLSKDTADGCFVYEMGPRAKAKRDEALHEYKMENDLEYAMVHEDKYDKFTQGNDGRGVNADAISYGDRLKAQDNYLKGKDLDQKKAEFQQKQSQDNFNNKMKQLDYQQKLKQGEFKHSLLDADFKKANELMPTPIVINFNVIGDGDTITDKVSFVAGIKCRLIATTSQDIIDRLSSVNKSKLSFKDLIRATTGEIKFTKDFLLAVDQQKLEARNSAKNSPAAKLWNVLKKRSVKNSANAAMRRGNDATAITTLIVSQDTANVLASVHKFDVSVAKNAKAVMDAYNLLCVVIADDTNEVAKFLYDGNTEFESISYSLLTKEALDQHYKKEINLINQR